jgi:hypothetical protein
MTLRTAFSYADAALEPFPNLSERIERHFGIRDLAYRVILGELDILLRDGGRWESMEIRTNPSEWLHVSLPDLDEKAANVWAEFQLTFDENSIASLNEVVVVPAWDVKRRRLSLRLNSDLSSSATWSALADTVAIGVDEAGRLTELRLDAIDLTV